MENSKVTELTRNLAINLNKKYKNVGVAIQANLYRDKEDLNTLIRKGVSVRLVKGTYKESEKIAYQDDFNIDSCFCSRSKFIFRKSQQTRNSYARRRTFRRY